MKHIVRLGVSFIILCLPIESSVAQVTHRELIPKRDRELPAYLESWVDPQFGTTITRITGDVGNEIPGIPASSWGDIARHHYSKDSAWNSDESLLYLQRHNGQPALLFLDGNTYQVLFGRDRIPGKEVRWHPAHPDTMVFVGGDSIGFWDPRSNATHLVHRFEGVKDLHMGPWEGNLSRDGKWVVLNGHRDESPVAIVFQLEESRSHAEITLEGIEVDWVSISPSGRYLVINGRFDDGKGDQTQVLDLEGRPVVELWPEYGRPSHYDLTLDADGEDIAVGVSKSAPDDGRVIKRRLRDGAVTVLSPAGYASHTSARNTGRAGWVYVGFPLPGPSWPPFHDELLAVSLDGSLRIERLAHMRATRTDYVSEAHAVASPSGTRVLWAGNWNAESGRPIACYVVEMPWLVELDSR